MHLSKQDVLGYDTLHTLRMSQGSRYKQWTQTKPDQETHEGPTFFGILYTS